jgi:hypothetical protein
MSSMQAIGSSSAGCPLHGSQWHPTFGLTGRTDFRAGTQPVTYADMQTCKPSSGPEGRLLQFHGAPTIAPAPRRSITDAGILKKHVDLGAVLQLPAHAI